MKGAAEVRFAKRDGEDALVFLVFKLKSFGMRLQNDSEGKLYITREKIVYEPNADRRSFFSAKRAEIKGVEKKPFSPCARITSRWKI